MSEETAQPSPDEESGEGAQAERRRVTLGELAEGIELETNTVHRLALEVGFLFSA